VVAIGSATVLDLVDEMRALSPDDQADFLNTIRRALHEAGPHASMPVDHVQWVPIEKVRANDYNPNSVARNEMRLLYVSIAHDGYTQPIVTVYDPTDDRYVIVDGFHRYFTLKNSPDLMERTRGRLPVVVIDKPLNDRMASTVRHNRARGKHSVDGMASMVFQMLEGGWDDAAICSELGMEAEELVRLKHVTGFSKLFENVEYQRAWKMRRQIQAEKEWERTHAQ
jgi:ParB-like chromosome segregation protein Spo0J